MHRKLRLPEAKLLNLGLPALCQRAYARKSNLSFRSCVQWWLKTTAHCPRQDNQVATANFSHQGSFTEQVAVCMAKQMQLHYLEAMLLL